MNFPLPFCLLIKITKNMTNDLRKILTRTLTGNINGFVTFLYNMRLITLILSELTKIKLFLIILCVTS